MFFSDSLCSERSISTAHKNLKFLIKSILEEAKNNSNHHEEEECKPILGEQDQTYEGILATAILNKVRGKYNLPNKMFYVIVLKCFQMSNNGVDGRKEMVNSHNCFS